MPYAIILQKHAEDTMGTLGTAVFLPWDYETRTSEEMLDSVTTLLSALTGRTEPAFMSITIEAMAGWCGQLPDSARLPAPVYVELLNANGLFVVQAVTHELEKTTPLVLDAALLDHWACACAKTQALFGFWSTEPADFESAAIWDRFLLNLQFEGDIDALISTDLTVYCSNEMRDHVQDWLSQRGTLMESKPIEGGGMLLRPPSR